MHRTLSLRAPLRTPGARRRVQPRVVRASVAATRQLRLERDAFGVERVAYEEEGWQKWKWRGIDVNYIAYGSEGPPILLIHGFGASAYQWRYNIPSLAQKHRVFAMDLVGFGKSEKLVMDYSGGQIWSDQIADFIDEFVGEEGTYIAGNSLGGFAALATAARTPEKIKGIVGLNIAGTFSEDVELMPSTDHVEEDNLLIKWRKQLGTMFRRMFVIYSFYATRFRIRNILMMVYHNKDNVDDDLVRSIEAPAEDPAAGQVYYKLIQSTLSKRVTIDSLLDVIDVPLLLLWGMKDPWITPSKAERILEAYKKAEFVPLEAGHCVMDECPEAVNENLKTWIAKNESVGMA